jgi:uncharacterized protein
MKEHENRRTSGGAAARLPVDYPISPVPARSVTFADAFWLPRLETNRTVTIPAVLDTCESSGRVDNFRRAAGRLPGPYVGTMPFEDTDVYKAAEGASGSLASRPDEALEARLDAVIEVIAAAQEKDGYLYTNRTIDPSRVLPDAGPERWSSLVMSHELYNCGHLYEAAAAHYQATGKRTLLEVALCSAELVCSVFRPGGRHDADGHQIVERGLARLYRLTGNRRFLETARFFLEQRGRHETRPLYQYAGNPAYAQDHLPVREQREAVGHAVRAVYMYGGMADVAALFPDASYAAAIQDIWRNMVETKLYLTGGIGARHTGESFGDAYELPNDTAYNESCAAIGSVMWNHRLFLLTGQAQYCDVMEQTLYNSLLSGVSLRGDRYFYVNPLESDGKYPFNHGSAGRRPWFDVSCCPTSLSRFFPALPGCVYAAQGERLYVNLFIGGGADVETTGGTVRVTQETDYPWSGTVRLRVGPSVGAGSVRLRLMVRIPGWARDTIMGGSLYRFGEPASASPSLHLDGAPVHFEMENGYAAIDQEWSGAETLELSLPMPVRTVHCDERVEANRGKAALMRGPLVYCVEGRDAQEPLETLRVGGAEDLQARRDPSLLGGVVVVAGDRFTAIPYYAWANRGPGTMKVWLNSGRS